MVGSWVVVWLLEIAAVGPARRQIWVAHRFGEFKNSNPLGGCRKTI